MAEKIKRVLFNVRFTPLGVQRIKDRAKAQGVSVSEMARMMFQWADSHPSPDWKNPDVQR